MNLLFSDIDKSTQGTINNYAMLIGQLHSTQLQPLIKHAKSKLIVERVLVFIFTRIQTLHLLQTPQWHTPDTAKSGESGILHQEQSELFSALHTIQFLLTSSAEPHDRCAGADLQNRTQRSGYSSHDQRSLAYLLFSFRFASE